MSAEFFRKYLNILNESKKLDEFVPPSGGGGDGDDGPPPKRAMYEIRLGENPNVQPKYLAIGDPQMNTEFEVYSLDCSKKEEPNYYGCHMTLVSRLPWTEFLDKIIGKVIDPDSAIEMGYIDVNDHGNVFSFTDKKYNPADKKKLRSAEDHNEVGVAEIVMAELEFEMGINDISQVYKNIRTGKIVAYVVGNDSHM